MQIHYVILDESQNIKNPSSKSFKAVKQLKSKHKLILSGTPVENTVNDLWTQMSFINPGLLGTQAFFQTDFVQPMTEAQADVYEKVKSEYRNELLKGLETGEYKQSPIQMLQGLTKLRQIANHPYMVDKEYKGDSGKFEDVIFKLQSVVEAGHKVFIFSQFVKRYSYLDGSTTNRGKVVEEFKKEEEIQIFLISIKAGGVGLNLTEADYVFILDPWWNPAVEQQAIDRTHRIGQTKNVFIYKFITKDTVEEKILALQNKKLRVAKSLITTEESFIKSLSADDIREILA